MLFIKKQNFYSCFGYVGVVFWFLDTWSKIFFYGGFQRIFWYCSLGFLFVLIGYFKKNSFLLTSMFCALCVVELLWTIGFLMNLASIMNFPVVSDISKYVFAPQYPKMRIIITMYHLLILPMLFYGIYKLKRIHKFGFLGAGIFVLLCLVLGFYFPDSLDNMNCAYRVVGDSCFVLFKNFYALGYAPGYIVGSIFISLTVFLPINIFLIKLAEKNNWKIDTIKYKQYE